MSIKKVIISCVAGMGILLMLSGCTLYQGVENTPPKQNQLDTKTVLFNSDVAVEIVDHVKQEQSKRELEAWQKGPEKNLFSGSIDEKSPRDGWQPSINHPSNEMNILEHYGDGIALSHLLKSTPAKVLMNDDLILVSLPNSWLFGRSYASTTLAAKPYIELLAKKIGTVRGRVNVQSYPPNWQINLNRQILTTARAEQMAEYISLNSFRAHGAVKGVGFGNDISSEKYLDDATVIEIRHPFKLSSVNFLPEGGFESFSWYATK